MWFVGGRTQPATGPTANSTPADSIRPIPHAQPHELDARV